METNVIKNGGYTWLKDLKLEITNNKSDINTKITLCFWLYLPADSSPFPSTLIHQVFLILL